MDVKSRRPVAAAVLTFALLGAVGAAHADSTPGSRAAVQERLQDARNRIDSARSRERALAVAVTRDSERIDVLEREVAGLAAQVGRLQGRLSAARRELATTEDRLRRKTDQLRRARSQARVAQRLLAQRLVVVYTGQSPDALEIVLGARSFGGALEALDARKRMLDYDERVLGQVRRLRATVARERARVAALRELQRRRTEEIAEQTAARRTALASATARRDEIVSLRTRRERSLSSVRVDRRTWEKQADALQAESARLAAVIAAAARRPPAPVVATEASAAPSAPQAAAAPAAAPAASSSTGFVWPVRGTITSPFGQRWGRLHAGLDIAAPAGTPIVASASGRVTYAGSMGAYGLIVVIQHAGGISTAYAHNSRLTVSTGQSVGQGQMIAAVGCTGSCTGNHVHFELRVGGSPVDPMGYL